MDRGNDEIDILPNYLTVDGKSEKAGQLFLGIVTKEGKLSNELG